MTKTDAPVHRRPAVMPSDVDGQPSFFDRFATLVSGFASRAYFFAACLLIVVLWLPSYFLLADLNTWQLIINTLTTIVTFLMVALLQNTQTRAEAALQQKLNAIADALADLMGELSEDHPSLAMDRRELAEAVGLEQREST
jgi:low affinity Fe/Cu permease